MLPDEVLHVTVANPQPGGLHVRPRRDGIDDPSVQVTVKRGGEEVDVVNEESGWKTSLKAGTYGIELKGSGDRFQLDQDSITVGRGGEVKVRVTLKKEISVRKWTTENMTRVSTFCPRAAKGRCLHPQRCIGLSLVQRIALAVGGRASASVENGQFHVSVCFPAGKTIRSMGG